MITFGATSWSFIWGYIFLSQTCIRADIYEDISLTTTEHIRKQGYPLEIYSNIVTEDNYLLDVYRIPHGKNMIQNHTRQHPILFMHGLVRTSRDFVVMGPKSLPYLLADRGYDIWLGNTRASRYSRKHLTLNPDTDNKYWDFSWHEIGIYDIPATLEIMKNITGKERFSYIGISEGTTTFYVLAAERPQYNQNISIMISLAPTAYVGHIGPIVRLIARFEPMMGFAAQLIGLEELLPAPIAQLSQVANRLFCTRNDDVFQDICSLIVYMSAGYDPVQLNKTRIPLVLGIDKGGSVRQMRHYLQNINSGLFRQYDYGRNGNLRKYGTVTPPSYDLSKVTAPVALIYSDGDLLAPSADVGRLCTELSNCVYKYKIPVPQFNHVDFIIANDVIELVHQKILDLLEKYDTINN